jgi:hypothetical protein
MSEQGLQQPFEALLRPEMTCSSSLCPLKYLNYIVNLSISCSITMLIRLITFPLEKPNFVIKVSSQWPIHQKSSFFVWMIGRDWIRIYSIRRINKWSQDVKYSRDKHQQFIRNYRVHPQKFLPLPICIDQYQKNIWMSTKHPSSLWSMVRILRKAF